jgi:adenine-specific DNA-methyltransferase
LKFAPLFFSPTGRILLCLPRGEGQDGASFKPKRFSKPYTFIEWRSINFPIIHAFSVSLQQRRVCHYAAYNYLFREKTMNNLAQTKDALAALAQQFRSYNYKSLNESQVRKSYIDEFWNILGWNTADIRQVQVETRDRNNKKPDYRFLVQNKTAFFVEAKKPSEDLMKNSEHIFQAKSYCWSGNVPLVVLTDFEEFRPFKCVNQPDKNKPKDGIIKQLDMTFEQYADRAEELLLHFGYESVVGGSLAQLLQLAKVKDQDRVDRVFLKQLAEWRKVLAEKAALVNTFHSSNELAEAVQRILDRLVFLRILQDRSIEDKDHLRTIAETKKHAYKTFVELCQTFSHTYNGLIFNAHPLSESITIHDLDFKPIVQELLPDESPYRFDEIPVEVLGTIYERFLGDEIILQGRSAIVETKPDVRKAGGVYYTPQYIVEYIVNNTVGALLAQCNNPKEVAALTICDPACGSGSFLLGAFDALIAWHEQYFEQHPDEWKEKSGKSFIELAFRDSYNKVRLTAEQKGRIAKNNLFGVDLDRQATEVTQMSLYIKILETIAEEPSITISYRNAILPKLSDNIKHGNSLVDVDYYDMFPEEQHNTIQSQIRPFNWKHSFPAIFKKGGFDAVIGNPPYLRIQGLQETQPNALPYFKFKFNAAETGSYDIYVLFIEQGFFLLKTNGYLGYIQPHKFFQSDFGIGIRNYLINNRCISKIVSFGHEQIFSDATTYTCLLFLENSVKENIDVTIVDNLSDWLNKKDINNFISQYPLIDEKWNFSDETKMKVLSKINLQSVTLGDVTKKIFQGIPTGNDKIFVLKLLEKRKNASKCFSVSLNKEVFIENDVIRPFLMGKEVKKYEEPSPENIVLFPYEQINGKITLMNREKISNQYPLLWEYLNSNKNTLENRENKRFVNTWWQYSRPQNLSEFENVKIVTPEISNKPNLTLDSVGDKFHTTKVYSFVFREEYKENKLYWLSLLNSNVLWYFLSSTGYVLRGGFFTFKTEYLKPFPVRLIDFTNLRDIELHNHIISLVQTMLDLHKTKEGASGEKLEQIQARISHTDDKINRLVYELYELTDEEIRIVEGV